MAEDEAAEKDEPSEEMMEDQAEEARSESEADADDADAEEEAVSMFGAPASDIAIAGLLPRIDDESTGTNEGASFPAVIVVVVVVVVPAVPT